MYCFAMFGIQWWKWRDCLKMKKKKQQQKQIGESKNSEDLRSIEDDNCSTINKIVLLWLTFPREISHFLCKNIFNVFI